MNGVGWLKAKGGKAEARARGNGRVFLRNISALQRYTTGSRLGAFSGPLCASTGTTLMRAGLGVPPTGRCGRCLVLAWTLLAIGQPEQQSLAGNIIDSNVHAKRQHILKSAIGYR
jgi:hypothetical protein